MKYFKMYPIEWTIKKAYSIVFFVYNKVNNIMGRIIDKKLFTSEEVELLSKINM